MANTREELLNDKLDYLYDTKTMFKDVLEELGVDITDEDTLRDYVEKITTIDTSKVKLFETEEDMLDYDDPVEDMLAIVYKLYINNMSLTEYMQYLIFSEEVVVSEECMNTINANIKNKNNVNIGEVYITPTSFYFNINIGLQLEVTYTSDDGIHYTRTSNTTNPVDVINPIITDVSVNNKKWFEPFIKYEKDVFTGFFRYINNEFVYIPDIIEKTSTIALEEANVLADTIRGE